MVWESWLPLGQPNKIEWNEKTLRHNLVCFGESFARLAPRLVKGAYVLVQGEHVTRNYDKTIDVPHGKKTIQVVIKAMAVELKADTIKIFDRAPQLEEQPVEPPRPSTRPLNKKGRTPPPLFLVFVCLATIKS